MLKRAVDYRLASSVIVYKIAIGTVLIRLVLSQVDPNQGINSALHSPTPAAMFSIIIPSWNNLPFLQLCIKSIRKHSQLHNQIVIHINDGSDGSLAWVRDEGIRHTQSEGNIGICQGTNLAAALAEEEYIVYMNDDMYCCPGWDTALAAHIRALDSNLFMLSGTMIEPSDTGNACVVHRDFGNDIDTFNEEALLATCPSLAREDWRGASWPPTVVHRDWWHKLGGYSSEFSPGMSSDTDLSMKMWQAGCRAFIGVGDSLIYHFQQKSTTRIKKNDGKGQFLQKWGVSQKAFNQFYLRRGTQCPANARQVDEPVADFALTRAKWLSRFKRALA